MEKNNLCEKMGMFSRDQILPCHHLGVEKTFPWEIWSAMGENGLLNPESLMEDRPCMSIAQTTRGMVENGGNLGLALSWMIHQITAHYLVRPHLAGIVDQGFWDRIKMGRATVSFAVSEPKVGAHPKYMEVRARNDNGHYLMSGEKAYLTNGPIAACFLVIAITEQNDDLADHQGKKAFSAFILPRNTPGLVVGAPMDIPFFKPAPHGNIRMDNCRLDRDALVGVEGRAFPDMVLPFRKIEDAAMTGAVTGAMSFLVSRVAGALAGEKGNRIDSVEALGTLGAMTDTAVYLSDQIALMTDTGVGPQAALVLYFRQMVKHFLEGLDKILMRNNTMLEDQARGLINDLSSSAKIGSTLAGIQKQKIGRRLLEHSARQ